MSDAADVPYQDSVNESDAAPNPIEGLDDISEARVIPFGDSAEASEAVLVQPEISTKPEIPVEPKKQARGIGGSATMSTAEIAEALGVEPVQLDLQEWLPGYSAVVEKLGLKSIEPPTTYRDGAWSEIASYQAPLRGSDGQVVLGKDDQPIADPMFRIRVPLGAVTGTADASGLSYYFPVYNNGAGVSLSVADDRFEFGVALEPLKALRDLKPERIPALMKHSPMREIPRFIPPEIGEATGPVMIIDGTRDERPLPGALAESAPGSAMQEASITLNGSADERPYRFSVVAPEKPVSLEPEPSRGEQIWVHLRALAQIMVPARRPRNDEPVAENEPQAEEPAVLDSAAEFSAAVPRIMEAPSGAFDSGAKLIAQPTSPASRTEKLTIFAVDPEKVTAPQPPSTPATPGPVLAARQAAPAPVVTAIRSASAAITPPKAAPAQSLASSSGEAGKRAALTALVTGNGAAKPAASAAQAAPRSHTHGEVDYDPQATPSLGKRIGGFVAGWRGRERTPTAASPPQPHG